ncbi:hypothetical protein WA026_007104 [Henosepilachna vigintioctopunctata]|uniref:DUF4729 domain-containing protein n=1 Tax=Henosepilachna vigintioctopunctata TaxID=420089 RepID=A0AAW1V8H2_9CUCU
MVDSSDHWAAVCICNRCRKIPDSTSLYHCPFQHQFCSSCFHKMKKNYRGKEENGCFCEICRTSFNFKETKINPELLRKLKSTPGISRPLRYGTSTLLNRLSDISSLPNHIHDSSSIPVTVENLFGLPKSDLTKLLDRKYCGDSKNESDIGEKSLEAKFRGSRTNSSSSFCKNPASTSPSINQFSSHKPVICPHYPCNKMVAVSSFANHFRYEHPELKKYSTERNREILIPLDISSAEYGKSLCIAILTVYETNKFDLLKSRSTNSVIRTCRKFCQKVPLGSFWVMLSGSKSKKKSQSYILIWVFTNNDGNFRSTIELSTKSDNVSFSCFNCVNGVAENLTVDDLASKSNCLFISYGSVVGLLREGEELNLRVTVH